jgi:hypothetical protein
MTSKPGLRPNSGGSLAEICILARRCPVYRSRDSSPGFRMELENLACDAKGKGTSGRTARPKVPMRRSGADCPVVVGKRGNSRGAKGAGDLVEIDQGQLATGGTRWSRRKAAAFTGQYHVKFGRALTVSRGRDGRKGRLACRFNERRQAEPPVLPYGCSACEELN